MSEPAPQAQQTQSNQVAGQEADASAHAAPAGHAAGGGAGTRFTADGPIPPIAAGASGDGSHGPSASDQAFGAAGSSERMRVTATGLNVRLTPQSGSKTNIIGTLHHGEEIDASGHSGLWVKIRYRDREAYVHGDFVAPLHAHAKAEHKKPAEPAAHATEVATPASAHASAHVDGATHDKTHVATHDTATPTPAPAPAHAASPPAQAPATAHQDAPIHHDAPTATAPAQTPIAKPADTANTGHSPPPPLDHMAQFVFPIEGSGAIQKALVYVSAGELTLTPDVFFFFHGQWANYGIDPERYAKLQANDKDKHDKKYFDKSYVESGRAAAAEAMERAQGKNVIAILPQGVMGGGGSNGGQMDTLSKKGSLHDVIESVMKQLKTQLHGEQMAPGRIAISGHSAGGYEGVQEALAASGDMKDHITDVTLMDQEYGSGGQYEQVLGWMFHGKPGKSLRVVGEANQLRVGQFDEKHQAKGLWDRFVGPDALPAKAKAAGFTVVNKGGEGAKQGANKTVVYRAQVMKDSAVQCDVLILQSSLGHHPLRDDVMDDAILNIGQGAAGNQTFGTLNHGLASGGTATAATATAPVTHAAPAPTHHVEPTEAPAHNPDPTQPEQPAKPPKIHVASNAASPDLYKEGGVLNVSHLTRNGGDKKQRNLEDAEFEFKQKVYQKATEQKMKSKIFGGLSDEELAPISGWPTNKPERFRKELLPSVDSMLSAMKRDWEAGKPAGGISTHDVKGIGIVSGYRGPKEEMHLWDNYFLNYLGATTAARKATGDEFGDKAVDVMINYIGWRKATPGHSNHSNGTAVDLSALSKTQSIPNSYSDQKAWKASWHYAWLNANAASHNFRNYKMEAWHWEYDT